MKLISMRVCQTIEDLIEYKLTLTQHAIKQLGL